MIDSLCACFSLVHRPLSLTYAECQSQEYSHLWDSPTWMSPDTAIPTHPNLYFPEFPGELASHPPNLPPHLLLPFTSHLLKKDQTLGSGPGEVSEQQCARSCWRLAESTDCTMEGLRLYRAMGRWKWICILERLLAEGGGLEP